MLSAFFTNFCTVSANITVLAERSTCYTNFPTLFTDGSTQSANTTGRTNISTVFAGTAFCTYGTTFVAGFSAFYANICTIITRLTGCTYGAAKRAAIAAMVTQYGAFYTGTTISANKGALTTITFTLRTNLCTVFTQ